jgi:SsrA-binding protein
MAKEKAPRAVNILNRKAEFEYFFEAEYEAGIMLTGTEIKSIRAGYANLNDAYCVFEGNELYVRGLHISEYSAGSYYNHEAKRTRKLLLRSSELRKWARKLKEKGFTIIPYRMYINDRGFCKLKIALARGKKSYDKRETMKASDNKRELDRVKKEYK